MSALFDMLADIERRFDDLERQMAEPGVATNPARMQEIGRERSELEDIVGA